MKNIYIKKSIFLEIVERTYCDKSLDYLITLKDALSIIIVQRVTGGYKPYNENFKGLVKL